MVYFVSEENQNLLWDVIHKNSMIQVYLNNLNPDYKNQWFRNIISNFHNEYGSRNLSINDLKEINKKVIIYILQFIQQQNNQNTKQNSYSDYQNIQTPPYNKNNREEEYVNQFEMRQKEYNQMLEKKAPDEINFSENMEEDKPIQDMKALMKKHIEERDKEISWQTHNPKLTIDEQQIPLQTDTIEEIKEEKKKEEKKKVSWEDSINYQEKYNNLKENYSMLYEDYYQMKVNK